MKIRMKATAAGPGIFYMLGSIADVPKEQAAFYVKGGYAEYVSETVETAAVEVPEAAETETAEEVPKTASKTTAKKKAD